MNNNNNNNNNNTLFLKLLYQLFFTKLCQQVLPNLAIRTVLD